MQWKLCHLTGFTQCQRDASEFRQSGYACLPNRRLYAAIAVLQMLQSWPFGGALPKPCELICSQSHDAKTCCNNYNIRITDLVQYSKLDSKKCFNCANHNLHK